MRVEAKVFIPGKLFDVDAVRLELLNAMRRLGTETRRKYAQTYATWQHEPHFEQKVSLTRSSREGGVEVWTDDEQYGYVENGTSPHPIVPHNPSGLLTYQRDFTPKTTPRVIGSSAGGKSGRWTRRRAVKHPGNKACEFSSVICDQMEPRLQEEVDAAIQKAMAKAGGKRP